MSRAKKKHLFKKCETIYHKAAVRELAEWLGGVIEQEFKVGGQIVFVPDVTCYKDGILDCIYEVVHSHPLTAKKYGLIQYYCYMNACELTVFEISADFIMKQTEKPYRIETMECYIINPFEYDEIQHLLLKSIA